MNTYNYKGFLFVIAVVAVAFVVTFLPAQHVYASCDGVNMSQSDYQYFLSRGWIGGDITVSGLTANAHYFNDTACVFPASLASFKMYDRTRESQVLFSRTGVSLVQPHSSLDLSINLPDCMAQIDAYYGSAPSTPVGDDDINFAATFSMNNGDRIHNASGNFCTNTPPPPAAVTASCSATPSSVNVGGSIAWSAIAAGGIGSYTYSWAGTDGLSGSAAATSKTYPNSGTKNATITVTSGTQTATANCSATVISPTLSASCSASPSSIQPGNSTTFTSNVSGGTGSYTYLWSNDCTGSNSNCSNSFSTAGTKTANLTVTSDGQTASTSCSVAVSNNPISVSCSASPSSIQPGNSTTFTSNVSGGTGSYTYLWSGACSGSGSTCSNNIYGSGTQNETLTITSGSQSNSASCSVNIGQSCTLNYQQRCLGNSMYWYDSCGNQGNYIGSCGITNNNATLSLTKTVRDLTTGTGFSNSTYANPSDTLMFMITLQANGNQNAQNVFVRDTLPLNLIYNNQLIVACSGTGSYGYNNNCNNNNYNYSGNITSGVNLGTIYAGQTVTITYQVQLASAPNFAYGTTTLNNLANATSSNVGYIPSAIASAIVTRSTVLGASTVSTGLTNNFWVDSFFLPLLITLIAIWMWKSGMFFVIEKWLDSKKKIRRGYKAEKELSSRIAKIQKFGNR